MKRILSVAKGNSNLSNVSWQIFSKGLLILLIITIFQPLMAQQVDLAEVRKMATSGNHEVAEANLSDILDTYPDFTEARLLRAHNFSWWKKYQAGIKEFDAVLNVEPENVEALVGKGYAESWSGSGDPVATFSKVLKLHNGSVEARKGLAHYFLIKKEAKTAEQLYGQLVLDFPQQSEFLVGHGKALLMLNEHRNARKHFKRALEIDPENESVEKLIEDSRSEISVFEFDLSAGYSAVGGVEKYGIRSFQVAWNFAPQYTIYGRYDNTLSLDNLDMINRQKQVPGVLLGGTAVWTDKTLTKIELGNRFFPEGPAQATARLEQVFFFSNAVNIKVGGFSGVRSNIAPEWVGYTSLYIPVSKYFSAEPVYFYARDGNSPNPQHRFMLSGKFRHPKGFELSVGGFYGIPNISGEGLNNKITGGYVFAHFPVSEKIWVNISVSQENGVFNRSRVFSSGLKYKLERK